MHPHKQFWTSNAKILIDRNDSVPTLRRTALNSIPISGWLNINRADLDQPDRKTNTSKEPEFWDILLDLYIYV